MKFDKLVYKPPERKLVAVLRDGKLFMQNRDRTGLMVIYNGICREHGGSTCTLESIRAKYVSSVSVYEGDKVEVTF